MEVRRLITRLFTCKVWSKLEFLVGVRVRTEVRVRVRVDFLSRCMVLN